jgi:uncharacterized protein YjbJ (UPF0337 family)
MWNKDEARGKADQLKGRVKQAAGDLSNDEQLREDGAADEVAGNVEKAAGTARRKVGEAIKDLGDRIRK